MKIGIISNLYTPHTRGGAEKIAQLMAEGLAKDHEVFVVTSTSYAGKKSLTPEKEQLNGVNVYRYFPLNIFYYLNDHKHNAFVRLIWHVIDLFNLHSSRKVKEIIKYEKPDVVITHNLKGLSYLIPSTIKNQGIKHIHVLHDVQYAVPSGLIIKGKEDSFTANGFLTKGYQAICKFLFNRVDIVVSPSNWLIDFYSKKEYWPQARKVTLPNPIATNKTIEVPEHKKGRQLLFLGQIEDHKGVEFLLQVISNQDYWNLSVAGDGSQLESLKKKFSDNPNINFLGRIPQDKLPETFAKTDFLVVPSLCYENSPTVIYESFSFGVPVIASKIGGTAELIQEGETGMTFGPGSSESLNEALANAEAISDETFQNMKKSCSSQSHNYTLDFYLKQLIGLINS